MKIAVIGTGWLGHPLAEALVQKGFTVYGSKRSERTAETAYTTFVYPSETVFTQEVLQQADIAILAFPPNRTTAEQYTSDCLRVCEQLSKDCKVIMVSSTSVYDVPEGTCREADFPPSSQAPHAIGRAEYALQERLGKRLTIVRMAGLTGPGRYPVRAMSASGKTYEGNEPVNLIHQDDAVGLIVHIVEKQLWGSVINGCAQEHPLRGPFYTRMADQLGIAPPLFVQNSNGGKIIAADVSRELGFRYRYDDPYDFPVG